MGFSTGADKMLPSPNRGQHSNTGRQTGARKGAGGVFGLWGVLGAGAISVLVWLVVDLGGPAQFVSAMYSAQGQTVEWASLRRDIDRLNLVRPNGTPDKIQDVAALKRRVAMLEGLLTDRQDNTSRNSNDRPTGSQRPPLGAPRSTATILAPPPSPGIADRFAPLRDNTNPAGTSAKGSARPPTHLNSRPEPARMALATNSAKRSSLAPDIVYGLDLGAYDSIEVLKKRWQRVGGQHGDILGDLTPRRVTVFSADGRISHRLIAAPLADAMEVARRCAALQARSVPCRQTLGIGEPL